MLNKSLLRRFVVVRRYAQNAVTAVFLGFLRKFNCVARVVAACSAYNRNTSGGGFYGVLNHFEMLVIGKGGRLACCSADNYCVGFVSNVHFDKLVKLFVVGRAVRVKRSDKGNARACKR